METTETEVPIYSFEELLILWETGRVKRYSIIEQMGRLLRQQGEDAPQAKAFLERLRGSGGVGDKRCARKALYSAARGDKEDRRNHK